MTTLRLRIDTGWPARATKCEWALYDASGNLAERGASEPQHWPQSEACELVLSADQCLAVKAQLPKGVRHDDANVIGYAIEEHLLGDVQDEHVVAGARGPDGCTVVWVIAKARLSALMIALKQLGRTPRRAYSELELAPVADSAWTVVMNGAKGYVRLPMQAGFSFEATGREPPAELILAVQSARAAGELPAVMDVYCTHDAPFDADAWHAMLGVQARRAGDYAWATWCARGAINLLVGDFAPPRSRYAAWAPFRPAFVTGAAALVLYTVFSLGEWAWLAHRTDQLRAQTLEIFRGAFPQVQTIVDPVLQMQRLYEPLMRERGRMGESDFLPLLDAVSDALGPSLHYRSLGYEDGRLEFTVILKDGRAPERLREALARRGLRLTLQDSRQTGSGIETSFSVRFGT
ncbi:MAG: type II secretion system protein GspL [Rhodospirillaceae bacterium]